MPAPWCCADAEGDILNTGTGWKTAKIFPSNFVPVPYPHISGHHHYEPEERQFWRV